MSPIPERTVSVSLVADVSNYLANMQRASTSTTALGKNAQTTATLTSGVVSKIGGSLASFGNTVGGSVGSALSTIGNGIDQVTAKAGNMGTAFLVGGAAAVSVGLALQQLASGEVRAAAQLDTAITNAGDSTSDYKDQIDEAVKAQQNFDHSAQDTQGALTKLTNATGSTQTALDNLQVTADLAAVKHESLSEAATEVTRILGGSGSKTLVQFGIHMDGVGTKTEQAQRALIELAKKLDGQAASSVDNFGSKVDINKTKLSDWVDEIAGPVGSTLTTVGTVVGIAGGAWEIYGAIQEHIAAKQLAATAAIAAETAALEGETVAADAASVSLGSKLGGALKSLATGPVGFAALAIGAAYGVSALGTLTDAAYNNTISFKNAAGAAAAYQKQVALGSNTDLGIGTLASSTPRATTLLRATGLGGAIYSAYNSIGLGGLQPAFQGANASISKIDESLAGLVKSGNAKTAAEEFNKWKDAAKQAGVSTADMNKEFPQYIQQLKVTGTVLDKTSGSTLVFADATKAQAKALTDSTTEAIKSVAPLTDFGNVVTEVQKKLEDSATAHAAATKSKKDSDKSYYDGSSVSLAQFTDQLNQNNAAGQKWLDNIQKLAQTQPEIAAQFEAAGYTAVNSSLLQQLIDATPEQSAAYIKAQTEAIALAGKAAADALLADPYLEEAGHAISEKTATALGASIAAGVPVATALHDLGVKVSATPLNIPVTADVSGADGKISGLLHKFAGVSTVFTVKGSGKASANGNMFVGAHAQAFANGGEGIYSGGAPLYKFAEPETGWEAYISGRPGQNARNRQIWQAAGERLGATSGASGGVVTALVDPSLIHAVKQLAQAHQATLDNVGVTQSTRSGSKQLASLGAS